MSDITWPFSLNKSNGKKRNLGTIQGKIEVNEKMLFWNKYESNTLYTEQMTGYIQGDNSEKSLTISRQRSYKGKVIS